MAISTVSEENTERSSNASANQEDQLNETEEHHGKNFNYYFFYPFEIFPIKSNKLTTILYKEPLTTTSSANSNELTNESTKFVQSTLKIMNNLNNQTYFLAFIYHFFPVTNEIYTDISILNENSAK